MKIDRNTVVVITGATAGIGRATAAEFARKGARLALIARDQARLDSAREEVERLGGTAIALSVDVADEAQMEAAADRIERELGPIDIWVNNAMVTIFAPLSDIPAEDFRRVTEVTYLGTVWGTMAALRRMRPRDRGVILQVGSALAYRSIPLQSPYCGAKHAVRGFTESVRTELLHDGSRVRVTLLEMPGVNTPQFEWCKTTLRGRPQPIGTVYQPEVAARAVVWAAQTPRREVYVTLSSALAIWVDKFAPGLLDRYVALTAVDGQQSAEPVPPERPSNLWKPVAGDYAAHGRFDAKSRRSSKSLWLTMHRPLVLGLAAVIAAVGVSAHASRARARSRST